MKSGKEEDQNGGKNDSPRRHKTRLGQQMHHTQSPTLHGSYWRVSIGGEEVRLSPTALQHAEALFTGRTAAKSTPSPRCYCSYGVSQVKAKFFGHFI